METTVRYFFLTWLLNCIQGRHVVQESEAFLKHEKERARDVASGDQGDFNRKENELVMKMEDFLTKVGQQDNLLKYLPLLQRAIDTIKKQTGA